MAAGERDFGRAHGDEKLARTNPVRSVLAFTLGSLVGRSAPTARPRIRSMIDREQVLHVARLARLRLNDEEVERMAGELSGILEHVERISELDLEGVEPTSHVIALENVLRPDQPRPSWDRDEVLERAPDPASGSFRVPSPQA
jgi:aspartyl-tRNA(Asn)/glutamyl-tRNA(Gln) amidotransferase subunit C